MTRVQCAGRTRRGHRGVLHLCLDVGAKTGASDGHPPVDTRLKPRSPRDQGTWVCAAAGCLLLPPGKAQAKHAAAPTPPFPLSGTLTALPIHTKYRAALTKAGSSRQIKMVGATRSSPLLLCPLVCISYLASSLHLRVQGLGKTGPWNTCNAWAPAWLGLA